MIEDSLERAVSVVREGGIVAHACEGVWGLACDPFLEDSVRQIGAIKGRTLDKGLILIAHAADSFAQELAALPGDRREAVLATWPGNHTWVLDSDRFPGWVTGGRPTIAARVPGSIQARALAERFGGALISTSANCAGFPPARTERDVRERVGREVDYILPGNISGASGPSRISVAANGERIR